MIKSQQPLYTLEELDQAMKAADHFFEEADAMFDSAHANTDNLFLCRTMRQCTLTLAAAILAKNGRS
jgi:hypothetical protein